MITKRALCLGLINIISALGNSTVASSSGTTPAVTTFGNKFFSDGKQFFIKGIAYQPSKAGSGDIFSMDMDGGRFIDPMAEPQICLRDLPYLQKLGVNTVRVYSIDTDKEHDVCFSEFAKAGIYVLADLSEPEMSIVREAPTWDVAIYERYCKVVDSLARYPNVLGFFAGNEVTNDITNTDASPFVKASIRDVKQYIRAQGYRAIPVGYSTNDDAATRQSMADYFACGSATDDLADFYGINMYEWCGYSTFWASGYRERTAEFKEYPVPVFFSEFGCNTKRPRPFTEVEALYSRLMTDVWSGGIAYMYFEEPNQYGVVQVSSSGGASGGAGAETVVTELQDFKYLQEQFAKAVPQGVALDDYKKRAAGAPPGPATCPPNTDTWRASTAVPGTPDAAKCSLMAQAAECQYHASSRSNLTALMEYACGRVDCSAITGDGTTGQYGDFADCSPAQKASYVLTKMCLEKAAACDFAGSAVRNTRTLGLDQLQNATTLAGEPIRDLLHRHWGRNDPGKATSQDPGTGTSAARGLNASYAQHEKAARTATSGAQNAFYANVVSTMGLLMVLVMLSPFFE